MKQKRVLVFLLVLAAYAVMVRGADVETKAQAEPPWPLLLHDARNTGRSQLIGPQTANVLWQATFDRYVFTGRVVVDEQGSVYAGAFDKHTLSVVVLALNPDGSLKWVSRVGPRGGGVAIGADGTVYASGGSQRSIVAFHPDDGSVKWQSTFDVKRVTDLTVAPDGTLYFADPAFFGSCGIGGWLVAVNPQDGGERWRAFISCAGQRGPPAVAPDGTVYVFCRLSACAFQPNGSRKWGVPGAAIGGGRVAVGEDGTVYVVRQSSNLISGQPFATVSALDPDNGSQLWSVFNPSLGPCGVAAAANQLEHVVIRSDSAIIVGGRGFAEGSPRGAFFVFEPNGSRRTTVCLGEFVPTVHGYIVDAEDTIYAQLTPVGAPEFVAIGDNQETKWEFPEASFHPPVIGLNGVLHLVVSGRLLTFGPGPGGADSDGDGIPDAQDACPDLPEQLNGNEDGDGCPERQIILVPGISFPTPNPLNPFPAFDTCLDPLFCPGGKIDGRAARAISTFECVLDFIGGDVFVADLDGDGQAEECPTDVPLDSDIATRLAIDRFTHVKYYSYTGLVAYAGIDTWQRVADSALAFHNQMLDWMAECPTCSFDIFAHSLGGVVVAYWLSNIADADQVETIHSVLALASPLRGFRSAQLLLLPALRDVCSGRIPLNNVISDFCPGRIDAKVVPGLAKGPFMVLNNADDWITNGCLLLGATDGHGAWVSREPSIGLGLPAPPCVGAPLQGGLEELILGNNLGALLDALLATAEAHFLPLWQKRHFGPLVRRSLLNGFHDDTRSDVQCQIFWSRRAGGHLIQRSDSVSTRDGDKCELRFEANPGDGVIVYLTQGRSQGKLVVQVDGMELGTFDLGGGPLRHDRQTLTFDVTAAQPEHVIRLITRDMITCRVLILGFCFGEVHHEVHIDGFEIDRAGISKPRVNPGATRLRVAKVPLGQVEAEFSARWGGSTVTVSIISPSGRRISPNTRDPDVSYEQGDTFAIYRVQNPEPGRWIVELFGADVPPEGEEVTVSVTTIPLVDPPAIDLPPLPPIPMPTPTATATPTPTPTATPPAELGETGDVDKDGDVDVFDALAILNALVGIEPLEFPDNGDVNGDGTTSVFDARAVLGIVASAP